MIVCRVNDGIHLDPTDVSPLSLDRSIPYSHDHTLIIRFEILLEFAPMRWLTACFLLLLSPLTAAGWGEKGHLLINRLAIDAAASKLPEFMNAAREQIIYNGYEPDRWR